MADELYYAFLRKAKSPLVEAVGLTSDPTAAGMDARVGSRAETKDQPKQVGDFEELQLNFFTQMHALLDLLPMSADIMPIMQQAWLTAFAENHVKPASVDTKTDGEWTFYKVSPKDLEKVNKRFEKSRRLADALELVPQLALLGLVSQFDAYMGKLLSVAIPKKPHIISKSQKSFAAHEVLQYVDIGDFKDAVIEKEIEDFLRKSHSDQFDWLASTFDVKTTEKLESWPSFVEACERRNLFAHSNGVVSQQYIIKCAAAGLPIHVKRGERLEVTPEYLRKTCKIFLEIGIKIAQVISRKIDGTDEQARASDEVLHNLSYILIEHEHYDLALEMLDFACLTIKKHPDAKRMHMMIVNRANCLKFLGRKADCEAVLDRVDWSPYDVMFRVCVAALRDDVAEVVSHMPSLVGHEYITAAAYREWPVFHWVRDKKEFQDKFKDVYGENLVLAGNEGGADEASARGQEQSDAEVTRH